MNEGVFPRTIREDAFLRERDREVLERDLGYKVSQKLSAFDEEKLLFTLLAGAAGERLDCFYQRADEAGQDFVVERFLGAEVVVHGADVHFGREGDVADGGGVEAVLGEQAACLGQQAIAGYEAALVLARGGTPVLGVAVRLDPGERSFRGRDPEGPFG